MHIRPYQAQDWPRLCEIHDVARTHELRAASLEEAFLPLEVAAQREDLFGYELLVAERQGRVVGFMAFTAEEIAWCYVDPAHYREGIGRALVHTVVVDAPAGMSIEVLEGNTVALDFYKSCGFSEVGTLQGKMPGNESFAVTVRVLEMTGTATRLQERVP